MSFNTFGKIFRFTTWGESHGPAIGCVIDGCPPNISISEREPPGCPAFARWVILQISARQRVAIDSSSDIESIAIRVCCSIEPLMLVFIHLEVVI